MNWIYYNENDPFAAAWLRELIKENLIAPGEVDERSILEVKADDLRGFVQCHFFAGIGGWSLACRLAGWPDDRPIWTGSCPCQPLSSAGLRKGHADERHLWPAFHGLIAERRPPIVAGEQVASKDGREWFAAVRSDLETLGYACGGADLCAAGIGAPHIRQRLYWMADAAGARCDGTLAGPEREAWNQTRMLVSGSGSFMGNANEPGLEIGPLSDDGSRTLWLERAPVASANSQHCVLADAGHEYAWRTTGPCQTQSGRSFGDIAGRNEWSDLEWLPCTDGKARPAKPGIFPLVDGFSFKLDSGEPLAGKSRQGLLRGAGNAIVPQLAAVFLEAVTDVLKL